MKKYVILLLASMIAWPANAHTGEHSAGFLANVLHYISQPSHFAYIIIGAIVGSLAVHFMAKKKTR